MATWVEEAQLVFAHGEIHRTGEGCCCPGQNVACAACPQHSGTPTAERYRLMEEALRATRESLLTLAEQFDFHGSISNRDRREYARRLRHIAEAAALPDPSTEETT